MAAKQDFSRVSTRASVISAVPIRGSHFRDIVRSREFVDKSLLIKHILEGREHVVIEAPRGFGKSTNLAMLREFFEMEVDADGTAIYWTNDTRNFETFTNPPLKIFKEAPEVFKAYFAQSPVLYVDFDTVSVTTFQTFEETFRSTVAEMFARYDYLLKSKKLSAIAKEDFELHRAQSLDLSLSEVALGGEKLSWLLREHHQHKVVVLIDNYDAPVRKAVLSPVPQLDMKGFDGIFENVILFIARLVKDNSFVMRSILTGRLTIGATYNWEPDNLVHYSVFQDDHLFRYYGLTKDDVTELTNKFKKTAHRKDIEKWYGHYSTIDSNCKLYNTLSTINYLKTGVLKRYCTQSEQLRDKLSNLLPYEKMGRKLEESFNQETKVATVSKLFQLDLKEIRMMATIPDYKINQDLLLQYLAEIGFYQVDSDQLTIPNQEMDQELKSLVFTTDYLKSKFNIDNVAINAFIDSVDKLDQSENEYRNFIAAVLGLFASRVPVTSRELLHALFYFIVGTKFANVTSGESFNAKRCDLFVQRYDSTGIVINIDEDAFVGLRKAVENRYYEVFKDHSLKVGIVIGLSVNPRHIGTVSYLSDTRNFTLTGCRNFTLQGRQR